MSTNIITTSSKCHNELQVTKAEEITHLLAIDKFETSKRKSQIGSLKQAGDTHCGSFFFFFKL